MFLVNVFLYISIYSLLKTFRVGYYNNIECQWNIIIDLNLILDIILMRAINVKNSERRESIQLLKFLVDTIV